MRERKLGTCNASAQAGFHIQGFDRTSLNGERAVDRRGEIPSFTPKSEVKMMTDAIDVYLNTILAQQLKHIGVQSFPGAIEAVVAIFACDCSRRFPAGMTCGHGIPFCFSGVKRALFMSRGPLLSRSARSSS